MIDAKNIKDRISLAEKWLLGSGIQNTGGDSDVYGSFNAWYDANEKNFSFAYSEITGYGISTLSYLNKLNKNGLLAERSKIAADWLIDKAYSADDAFSCRFENGKFMDRFCTFDAGMCLNGLTSLYSATKDGKYLRISRKIADWMVDKMQKKDGSFYTRYFKEKNQLEDNGDKWSKQPGSFLAKVAIGLLNLYSILKDDKYEQAARKICDFALELQQDDGRFVTDNKDKSTFVHAHCYTAEGLLSAGIILNESKYIESAVSALKWITKHQMPSGGFPAYFVNNKFVDVESPDISSQVMRLYLLIKNFGTIDEISLDEINLDSGIKRIFDFQCMDNEKQAYGGFMSGKAWFYPENKNAKHVNSWVTMFIVQAVNMYLDKENIREFNVLDIV